MARALVDTGAIVALFNLDDPHHRAAATWFKGFRGQLLTTEAVVTETAYILASSPPHRRAALAWIGRGRAADLIRVEPVFDYSMISKILDRYANLPCDYADATLIELAERIGVAAIATIDQRDFSIYRMRGRRRFRILLP